MMGKLRDRLSYANVTATMALFVALGGTSYAAVSLERNSVTSIHIVNGQVRSGDLRDGDVQRTDLAAPVTQELESLPAHVRDNQLITGTWSIGFEADVPRDAGTTAISFPAPVNNLRGGAFVPKGSTLPQCPGSATDPTVGLRGFLCVYEGDTGNRAPFSPEVSVTTWGGFVKAYADNPGFFLTQGTWAIKGR